jgi:O-antigen ligase
VITTAQRTQFGAFAAAALLGVTLGVAIPALAGQGLYRLVMVVVGGASAFALVITGQPRRVLLLALMIAIPLNLAFLGADNVALHSGGAQPNLLIYLYDLPLVGLVGLWLLRVWVERAPVRFTAIDAAALLFILWNALSMYGSTDLTLSMFEIARMLKLYFLAHIVSELVLSERDVKAVLFGLGAALAMQAVVSALQYFFGYDLGGLGFIVGDVRRVSGTVGWPNTLGAYAAAAMCVPFTLWLCKVGGGKRWMLLALCLLGSLALVLTFSRGSWLGFGAGVIVAAALGFYASWLSLRVILASLVGLALIAVFAAVLFAEPLAERFSEETLTSRTDLNEVAFGMISTHPVLGIGVNTFTEVMRDYDTTGITVAFPEPVHNVFLLIASETGLVGLAIFLALVALVYRAGIQTLRRGNRFSSAVVIGLLAGLTAILISNLADVHLKTDVIFAMFWVYIGVIVAIRQIQPRRVKVVA